MEERSRSGTFSEAPGGGRCSLDGAFRLRSLVLALQESLSHLGSVDACTLHACSVRDVRRRNIQLPSCTPGFADYIRFCNAEWRSGFWLPCARNHQTSRWEKDLAV